MTEPVEKQHDVDYADPEEEKKGTFENKVINPQVLIANSDIGWLANCCQ